MKKVSIPSEREGTWKACSQSALFSKRRLQFQFPPNGKAHGKLEWCADWGGFTVTFQFPPNGKAHGKQDACDDQRGVSVLFQFPPNGKAHGKKPIPILINTWTCLSFNSLRTGRHMERIDPGYAFTDDIQVSIPSEREGTWKVWRDFIVRKTGVQIVSIPSEREGTWKGNSPAPKWRHH